LPYQADLQVDQEDSLGIDETASPAHHLDAGSTAVDVAVVRLPHISNTTDFRPLSRFPGVRVRYVSGAGEMGLPDLIVLPGSKATVRDLDWLRDTGLADSITSLAAASDGPLILGVCGGYQMLGRTLDDPLGVESPRPRADGLGLLSISTRFGTDKNRHRVTGKALDGSSHLVGYEIHMGETTRAPDLAPWFKLTRTRDGSTVLDGAVDPTGRVMGTYVHGLFDSDSFTADLVRRLRCRRGLPEPDRAAWDRHRSTSADRYAPLSALLRGHLNLAPVWDALGQPSARGVS
jgi:adenosylcobyric acid synthase